MLNFIVNWYIIMIYQLFRGILIMSNATEFEMRRRERRRRERLRKKRIRAAIIFIVLIAIIIVVAVAVSMKKGNNEQQNTNNVSIEATENPENVVPQRKKTTCFKSLKIQYRKSVVILHLMTVLQKI